MKLLQTKLKWKKRSIQKSKAELLKKRDRKHKKYISSSSSYSYDRYNPFSSNYGVSVPAFNKRPQVFHVAPENFSLINNTDEVLEYFSKAEKAFKSGANVYFNLENIKILTPESIALLVACVHSKEFLHDGVITGNEPKNKDCRLMLEESGFYKYVRHKKLMDVNHNENFLLHTVSRQKVAPKQAKRACIFAISNTFGKEIKFRPLYEILIECMANTHNHASYQTRNTYEWWLLVYFDKKTKNSSFVFLDLGCGIFESLPVITHKNQMLAVLGLIDNTKILKDLLDGKIGSRTGMTQRGRGIPLIYNHSKHTNINKLIIIANDVFADLNSNISIILKNKFKGTLICFELLR